MRYLHLRIVLLFTGYCGLCRGRGRVSRYGYWGIRSKACPVCTPPAEGYRVKGLAVA